MELIFEIYVELIIFIYYIAIFNITTMTKMVFFLLLWVIITIQRFLVQKPWNIIPLEPGMTFSTTPLPFCWIFCNYSPIGTHVICYNVERAYLEPSPFIKVLMEAPWQTICSPRNQPNVVKRDHTNVGDDTPGVYPRCHGHEDWCGCVSFWFGPSELFHTTVEILINFSSYRYLHRRNVFYKISYLNYLVWITRTKLSCRHFLKRHWDIITEAMVFIFRPNKALASYSGRYFVSVSQIKAFKIYDFRMLEHSYELSPD